MTTQDIGDIRMDADNLYREETVTDLKVGTIRQMIPIKTDGSPDPTRETIFSGQAHILTQMGPVPVNCPLESKTLDAAIAEFPAAVKKGVERLMDEARQYQREEAGRIVVPKPGQLGGMGGAPGGPGGAPGGNIQMP